MRRIEVDTNFNWLGPDFPALSHREVKARGLEVGERVAAYQDDDEWPGTVRFDSSYPYQYQWYIALDEE